MTRHPNTQDAVTPTVVVLLVSYLVLDFVVFRFANPPVDLIVESIIAIVLAVIVAALFFVRTTDVLHARSRDE